MHDEKGNQLHGVVVKQVLYNTVCSLNIVKNFGHPKCYQGRLLQDYLASCMKFSSAKGTLIVATK